ncbi:MAG: dephospho-CoA kinase [Phycisphaerales bacterium]
MSAEREVVSTRPSRLATLLVFSPFLGPAMFLIAAWAVMKHLIGNDFPPALFIGVAMTIVSVICGELVRLSRSYTLTDRRIRVRSGVFSRVDAAVPLQNIQNITMTCGIAERLVGCGSLHVYTAGSDGPALNWLMIRDCETVLDIVRQASEGAQSRADAAIPVIGLVGGVGAGKSTVAAKMRELGCLVIDADAAARQALERSDVAAKLVEWWGADVLGSDGKVDRAKVSAIVFADPEQRRRLESLVHPLVRADREREIARAAAEGMRAVVIDAPLLFEAGTDRMCDSIVFVDSPREERLKRVRARGWDEAELARREAAQMSLTEKQTRSDQVITNTGSIAELGREVERALERACELVGRGASRRNRSS